MKTNIYTIILLLSFGLNMSQAKDKIKIAISKGSGSKSYENYGNWLKHYDNNIEIIDLWGKKPEEAIKIIQKCDGLLLSGGPDVDPNKFGKGEDTSRCTIDLVRDTLEFGLIKEAFASKMPILSICRGEQIVNVAFGGDLIIDIPSDTKSQVIHQQKEGDSYHQVIIEKDSYLHNISKVDSAEVNSNHHQAVGKLAPVFKISSKTEDGLTESYEFINKTNKSWFIAVQWHPERLDRNSVMSKPIAEEFLKAVKKGK